MNRFRWYLFVCLVVLIGSVYMFTYSGRIETNDTRTLFNGTASFTEYGDSLLDKTAWYNKPSPLLPPAIYPLSQFDAEPLQVGLSAPLYWIAETLPGIGLVHTVWLLNIFVCTAIGLTVFYFALVLGYDERTAVLAALIASFTTIIWPYSKSFFREPLAGLMLLLAVLFVERWRSSRYRSIKWLLLSVLAVSGALLTKDAAILGLPGLLIVACPPISLSTRQRKLLHTGVSAVLVLIILFLFIVFIASVFVSSPAVISFYYWFGRLIHKDGVIQTIHTALHTYLFSIGGSIWGTSPISLLALPGLWILYRRHQYRYLGLVIALVGCFAFGYAIFRGLFWFGGLSWPPRFLVPVVPFLVIGALPIFENILKHRSNVWMTILVALILYGFWIQINAVSLDWGAYNAALPPEAGGLGEWTGGLNELRYLRWVLIPTLWTRFPLDFVWSRLKIVIWPVTCGFLVILSTVLLWLRLRQPLSTAKTFRRPWIFAASLLCLLLLVYIGLRAIYFDDLYLGSDQALHNLIPVLQSSTQAGDVLLLADNNYEPFFLNYGNFSFPRVITLPDQPGERSNPSEPPQITSTNPDALLVNDTVGFLHNLAATHDRLWLLADTGPWLPWSIRPIERFMVAHYYPMRELSTNPPDPRVRLIEYSTAHAPDPFAFRGPDNLTNLRFGPSISLIGFDLPSGIKYDRGSILPISLYWQTDHPLDRDYTVAWFVADANNQVVSQGADYQPAWGFSPTTSWQPNVPVWDNRAMQLPSDLKAGQYSLWIKLYANDPSGGLQLLSVTGDGVLNDDIAVLPVTIEINP